MNSRIHALVLTFVLAVCGMADARPPDFTVQLNLHKTVGDPTSDNDFLITMGLMEVERDGSDIGWHVQVVTIRQLNDSGEVVETWFKTNPFVDTADDLWWIEHADPDNPVNSEFLVPPLIYGTAGHVNPTEAALEFEFEGALYVAPPGGAPFPNTASLTTLLQEEGNPTPKKEETDEPVEAPDEPQEPYPS